MPAVAATALPVTAVVLPSATQPAAYASWTPIPTAIGGAELSSLGVECADRFDGVFDDPAGPMAGSPASRQEVADAVPLLGERRGEFSFALIGNDRWLIDCFASGPGMGVGAIDLSLYAAPLPATDVRVYQYGSAWTPEEGSATSVWGAAGDEVVSATVTRSDGEQVEATVANGLWAAWWPGEVDEAPSVALRLADGSTTAAIPLSDLYAGQPYGGQPRR